jgi:HEPN domain-containing protein
VADSRNWHDWVRFAEVDWIRANRDLEEFPVAAGVDLQQAAEKYLKAVLVSRNLEPSRTHSLLALLLAVEPGIAQDSPEAAAAQLISRIFPAGRYPGGLPEATVPEAQALARATGVLRDFARTQLGL